ncbi:hypothetical protein ACFV28_15930 [Streptomyces sp. NPDC059720]|uniref:hypothetical protein n=1 Tax=Streptomyces sp. NPDC059720 TaxID=3346924 RepID=UPI00368AF9D1
MTTLPAGLPPRWKAPLRIGLALSGWIALAAVSLLPDAGVLRLIVVCVFLFLCPGIAAARWCGPSPWRAGSRPFALESAFLPVALSLCLDVFVVVPFYLGEAYGTTRVLGTLAALTTVLALLPVPGTRRPGVRHGGPGDGTAGGRASDAVRTGERR